MFPGLVTMEAMLTSFQCCSLKMFPSNNIFFIVHMHDTMFPIENNISPFSHPGSKRISLLLANLATLLLLYFYFI